MDYASSTDLEPSKGHIVGLKVYLWVWLALVGLTALTIYASYLDFGEVKTLVAILIATLKASLVLLFFMHLKYDAPLFRWLFLVSIVMYAIFVLGTYIDFLGRVKV